MKVFSRKQFQKIKNVTIEVSSCDNVTLNILQKRLTNNSSYLKHDLDLKSLINFIEKYIGQESMIPNKITGRKLSSGRVTNLKTTLFKVKEYYNTHPSTKRVIIDIEFYYKFYNWMESNNYSVNYIGKQVSNLKLFLIAAFERKLLLNEDFKSKRFKITSEESDEIYLTISELKKIIDIDLSKKNKSYDAVRDAFIIGAFTGLRVSDYKQLKLENLITINGYKMITVATKKTGNTVIIPIHKYVNEILKKRNGNLPPKIHENTINKLIKEIGEMANLKEEVTKVITKGGEKLKLKFPKYKRIMSHTARRSFCTNAYLAGLDSIDIMAISGHKTESSFLKYIKVTKQQVALRIAKHPFFNQ